MALPGRKKHFADEAELLYFFNEYLDECKTNGDKANLAGFARKCYCSKDTLLEYKKEDHIFCNTMKMIYTFLEDATINNDMSDNFKKFYMTNTFKDYQDSSKLDIKADVDSKVTTTTEDVEAIRLQLAELLKEDK